MIIAKSIRAVIFDLDGTLIDTAGEIMAALNPVLEGRGGRPLDKPGVEALIGRGVRSMVERALARQGAGAGIEEAIAEFEERYAQTVGTASRLYPGVREGLALLERHGLGRAVVTNKPRYFTERLLQRLGVESFFGAVVAGDDGIPRKPAGDMLLAAVRDLGHDIDSALMVGDSENDILAARDAGCLVWCVPYGYNEGRPAETLACDRLVADVGEAASLLVEQA